MIKDELRDQNDWLQGDFKTGLTQQSSFHVHSYFLSFLPVRRRSVDWSNSSPLKGAGEMLKASIDRIYNIRRWSFEEQLGVRVQVDQITYVCHNRYDLLLVRRLNLRSDVFAS